MQKYLSPEGKKIYTAILSHIRLNGWQMEIDDYELSMLANAFDIYSKCATILNEKGMVQTANSGFSTARPECGIMRDQYACILKHSGRFGLSPGDRKRIFKVAKGQREPDEFDLL